MPLNYNPFDKVESTTGKAAAGTYMFKVDECIETTFRSGNQGLKVKLMVGAFDTKDVTVYVNLVYVKTALWKLEQFMASIGLDFQDPNIECADIVGRCGKAEFAPEGDKGYLAAQNFLPASANNAPGAKPVAAKQAPRPAPVVAAPVARNADEPF